MKKYNIYICHKEHATFGPNRAFITVELDKNYHWAVLHLAMKYNDGCMAAFLQDTIKTALEDYFGEEIKETGEKLKIAREESERIAIRESILKDTKQ